MISIDSYSNRFGFELESTRRGPTYQGIIGLQVRKQSGIIVREHKFSNLIMSAALNRLGTQTAEDQSSACQVGTGTAEPNVTQTSLFSSVGTSATGSLVTRYNSGAHPYYTVSVRQYIFAAGVAAGNLTEIGFFSGSNMFSRTLIKDETGSPTTLTILPDELLYVTYELRTYVGDLADVYTTLTLGGVTYDVTIRKTSVQVNDGLWAPNRLPVLTNAARISGSSVLPANTERLPGNGWGSVTQTILPYVDGSLRRSLKVTSPPSATNLAGGIRQLGVESSNYPGFAFLFSAPIPKDSSKSMTMTFTTEWSAYVP